MQISTYLSILTTHSFKIKRNWFNLTMDLKIEKSWQEELKEELKKPYMLQLKAFLTKEYQEQRIFPPSNSVFEAFNRTPVDNVKAVILGQDPYHGAGQSHGLAFSVAKNVAIPPSLRNIYKALKLDFDNFEIPPHGNLSFWAEQGVLLLNTTLTVRENKPGSHQKQGWERFTDKIIHLLSEKKEGIVFLLWGKPAALKTSLIDIEKQHVLIAPHPSPLSAHRGFLTCKHFSQTNDFLVQAGKEPINWQIPN